MYYSFQIPALRPGFTGPVFRQESPGALGFLLFLLTVELSPLCCSFSPFPFPGKYLPSSGAEILKRTGVVTRDQW